MSSENLLGKYYSERFGAQSIEEPWGFICFNFTPPVCVIQDFYVVPEERSQGRGKDLLARAGAIAFKKECNQYWTQVCVGDAGAEKTLQMALHVGFKLLRAENNRIIMTKDIGG